MLGSKSGTVIAEGLRILGRVTAEGLVEVNGQIEGELRCTSLFVSRKAQVAGTIAADRIVVDGKVDGPIQGGEVILKSHAHVVGDIHHRSLAIEKGPILRVVRSKPMEQMDNSPNELAESDPKK